VFNTARFSRNRSPTDQLLATIDPAVMTTRNRKTVIIYPLLLLFLFAITAPLGIWAAEGASPVGLWKNEDAKIEIFKDGGKLDGKIAALNEKYTKDGQKKTDIHNPDPAERERPLIGLVVMQGIARLVLVNGMAAQLTTPRQGTRIRSALNMTAATP
jgi:Uncharacterized protein conserved in bacteria (DUF2147)